MSSIVNQFDALEEAFPNAFSAPILRGARMVLDMQAGEIQIERAKGEGLYNLWFFRDQTKILPSIGGEMTCVVKLEGLPFSGLTWAETMTVIELYFKHGLNPKPSQA